MSSATPDIIGTGLGVSLWSKIFANFPLQDFTVDTIAIDKKFIQLLTNLSGSGWPWWFTPLFRFTGSSALITIISWVTIASSSVGHRQEIGKDSAVNLAVFTKMKLMDQTNEILG